MRKLLASWLLVLLVGGPALVYAAPNKVWVLPGTALKFGDSAQTPIRNLTLGTPLAAGTGRCSAQYDKNALVSASGAMPHEWRWGATFTLNGTGTLGEVIELYIATSDGTIIQGNISTADAALASDLRKNLTFIGTVIVDKATATPVLMGAGDVIIKPRYFSVCVYNTTSLAFTTSTTAHTVYLTPMSSEIQAYAPVDFDLRTFVPAAFA
jgi:hypothetical protein